MAQTVPVPVPDLGDFDAVDVIDVLVKAGDTVELDTPLVTLETDKATMDVPSTAAGVVVEVKVRKGDKVGKGTVLVTVAAGSSAALPRETKPAPAAAAVPATPAPVAQTVQAAPAPTAAAVAAGPGATALPPIDEAGFSRAHASPSVRRFARELGVDLGRVRGSGAKSRITQDDVKAFVKSVMTGSAGAAAAGVGALPKLPVVDFARFGPVELRPLTRIQRISGPRLHASWVNIPHVTQFDEADITDVETTRVQLKSKAIQEGIRLTPVAFVVRACAKALLAFPRFAASLDASGENLVYKKYVHIGFAADTPNGLVVPVIRDADRKDLYEIARDLGDLSEKARTGKLSGSDMQGGCFTISSLGGIGGTAFTPIINAPEVAILGLSRSAQRPVYVDGVFVPRLILPLSLSYDHRVIDGAEAVRFTTFLCQSLKDVRGLLEAVP